MRKLLIAFLVTTTAATPALAQSASELRQAARDKRAEADEARSERRERARARRERIEEPRAQVRPPRIAPVEGPPRPAIEAAVSLGRASTFHDRPDPKVRRPRDKGADSVADWRRDERDVARARGRGEIMEALRGRVRPPADARPDRPAPPPRTAGRRDHSPRWGSGWHRDHRYNWRDHRRRNRWLFRLGFYFDPFGWSYRRYNRGWRLWPSYYDRNYWLSDPYMYRLPYAPHPYQWVRYWGDALLVDTYTGQVVDVVHNVFL